jgi:SAM-dependent methyltransferase
MEAGDRFAFGANWSRFLRRLDESRVRDAEASLKEMLRVDDLSGLRFLDAGSGSGLFSLAARRLGASVVSFDYDPQSVACVEELKRRFFPGDPDWRIAEASVLDANYLSTLSRFDVVYSWGVLHHTGAMWDALDKVGTLVDQGGRLFVAIYNDEGLKSRYWRAVKKWYCQYPLARAPLLVSHAPSMLLLPMALRLMSGRATLARGMSPWHDLVDWIGGYPFEVATPEAIHEFYRQRGFRLDALKTTNRSGCNQFVLVKERPYACAAS